MILFCFAMFFECTHFVVCVRVSVCMSVCVIVCVVNMQVHLRMNMSVHGEPKAGGGQSRIGNFPYYSFSFCFETFSHWNWSSYLAKLSHQWMDSLAQTSMSQCLQGIQSWAFLLLLTIPAPPILVVFPKLVMLMERLTVWGIWLKNEIRMMISEIMTCFAGKISADIVILQLFYNSYFRFHKYGKLADLASINWISKVCENSMSSS